MPNIIINIRLYIQFRHSSKIAKRGDIHAMFLSDEGPTLGTLDFTIRIGSIYTNLFLFRFVIWGRLYTKAG